MFIAESRIAGSAAEREERDLLPLERRNLGRRGRKFRRGADDDGRPAHCHVHPGSSALDAAMIADRSSSIGGPRVSEVAGGPLVVSSNRSRA